MDEQQINHLAKLIAAFAKAKLEMGKLIATEKANLGSYNYTYADMAGVLGVIDKPLASNGLVFVQSPVVEYGQGARVTVHGTLYHESGGFLPAEPLIMMSAQTDPQKVGSAITYGRRYQAVAFFGLAQEDDDGKSAGEKPKQTTQPQQTSRQQPVSQPPVTQHRTTPPTATNGNGSNGHKPEPQPIAAVVATEDVAPSAEALDAVGESSFGADVVETPDKAAELHKQAMSRFHGVGATTFGPNDWNDVRHVITVTAHRESSSQFTAPELNLLADSFRKESRRWQTWQRLYKADNTQLPPVELAGLGVQVTA